MTKGRPILLGGAIAVVIAGLAGLFLHLQEDLPEAREIAGEAGLHSITRTWGATVGDYNGDGRQDVVIVPHYEGAARLYRNVGGRFVRVPYNRFPAAKKDRHDCDWGDVNGSGRLDLYCTVGGGKGLQQNPNELWIQRPDGSFVERAGEWGVKSINGKGRDVAFLDANGDGRLDLYVANGYPREDGRRSENRLYINVRGKRFRHAPEFGLNGEVGGSRVQAVDYDQDGWTDLLVCAQGDRLHLYRNQGGRRFVDVSETAGIGRNCRSAVLADITPGDRLDLVRVTRSKLVVKRQNSEGRFRRLYERNLRNGGDVAVGRVTERGGDDIYVLQRGPTGNDRDDVLLVNEADGRTFRKVEIPQTLEGKADAVVPIDHNGNGHVAFIVMNGKNKARGPIRLIAFR